MNVPTIGGARGIFEIFVPGVFLLLNVSYFAYSVPSADQSSKDLIAAVASNPASAVIVVVTFGYLVGVLLRLLHTDLPDMFSGQLNRLLVWLKRSDDNEWATDDFPYISWLGTACKAKLSPEAVAFYEAVWAPRCKPGCHNKQFFNFVKTVVTSKDARAGSEIYAAEAMSRYVACMFFALVASLIVMAAFSLLWRPVPVTWIFALLAYVASLVVIVWQFRSLRIKEVEAVFAASFKNRSLFEGRPGSVKKSAPIGPMIAPAITAARSRSAWLRGRLRWRRKEG